MFALVDCNNFYASCERVFNPSLQHKPIIVLSNNDGCVIARSQEAKVLGIKMAQPVFQLRHLIQEHQIAVFSSNYALYGDMSRRVMGVLYSLVPQVEVYSIDEAFLQLSTSVEEELIEMAHHIWFEVKRQTGIPVSVGIGPTKTIAKIANRLAKTSSKADGKCVLVRQHHIKEALKRTDIKDVWGLGRGLSRRLKQHQMNTAYDFSLADDGWVQRQMTIVGLKILKELQGESCLPLESTPAKRRHVITSRSFSRMIDELEPLKEVIANFASRCSEKLRLQGMCASSLIISLKTNKYRTDQPQHSEQVEIRLPVPTHLSSEIVHYAIEGLRSIYKEGYAYKKAGIILSDLTPEHIHQQHLFDTLDREKHHRLASLVDQLNQKLGKNTIRLAAQGFEERGKTKQEKLSPSYTTRWDDLLEVS